MTLVTVEIIEKKEKVLRKVTLRLHASTPAQCTPVEENFSRKLRRTFNLNSTVSARLPSGSVHLGLQFVTAKLYHSGICYILQPGI